MKNKRRNIIIALIIVIFTLGFSSNKLSLARNHKAISLIYPREKRYTVITTIDMITDYKDIDGEWLYDDIFLSADKVYEVYSKELAEQGWYDSNYVILLDDLLLKGIKMDDLVEITYIDIDLIPAKIKKGVIITDATTASVIIDIKKVK